MTLFLHKTLDLKELEIPKTTPGDLVDFGDSRCRILPYYREGLFTKSNDKDKMIPF